MLASAVVLSLAVLKLGTCFHANAPGTGYSDAGAKVGVVCYILTRLPTTWQAVNAQCFFTDRVWSGICTH